MDGVFKEIDLNLFASDSQRRYNDSAVKISKYGFAVTWIKHQI